ncbi:MAG: hypothetical protein HKO76_12410 [Acidimicrobiia bacterium]|nr:hypothetical protein [Acidimicrobiia bacterium]
MVFGCASDAGQDVAPEAAQETAPDANRETAATSSDLNQLSWMVGYWSRIEDASSSEEAWLPARGGVMVGVHVDLFSSGRSFFEYLRVESRGDTLVFLASPRGRKAVPFVASEISEGDVVFSNMSHDYPQHIGYTLVGADSLRSEIWGSVDGEERRSSWTWGRSSIR